MTQQRDLFHTGDQWRGVTFPLGGGHDPLVLSIFCNFKHQHFESISHVTETTQSESCVLDVINLLLVFLFRCQATDLTPPARSHPRLSGRQRCRRPGDNRSFWVHKM